MAKNSFCHYLVNYTHFGKNNDTLRSPLKNNFLAKNRYLPLSCKLYTFRQKQRYFEITLKKIFFSPKNCCLRLFRISLTTFWDHHSNSFFCQKIVFYLYLINYTHFGKKQRYFGITLKNLFVLPKNSFLPLSCKLYTFRQKQRYFGITLKKLIFFPQKIVVCDYFVNHQWYFEITFKRYFFLAKNCLCLYQ